jgi:hypothetical protein
MYQRIIIFNTSVLGIPINIQLAEIEGAQRGRGDPCLMPLGKWHTDLAYGSLVTVQRKVF